VVKSLLTVAPEGSEQWLKAAPSVLGVKLHVKEHVRQVLGADVPVLFTRHHLAHAASAFYPSPFEEAAILTIDGVGEWATTSLAAGRGTEINVLKEIHYPHSLGLLYSAFTYFCGFKVNSGEYKLMGLAPYGKPKYVDAILEHLIRFKPDGSFRLNMENFEFLHSNRMVGAAFEKLFGGPARAAESRITRREMDLAASVQVVTEQAMLGMARHAREATGMSNLVLAGGVALNCVANGRLLREKIFDHIWLQPAAGDAGGALGAALVASHRKFAAPRQSNTTNSDTQFGSYLGPAFSTAEVQAFLDRGGFPYAVVTDPAERSRRIAAALAEGKVVGFMAGRMEFGPRSLGSRSILGDPRNPDTQVLMNVKIKYRESFRPFAPAVLAEKCSEYFDLEVESPYMLLVAPVQESRRLEMDDSAFERDGDMLAIVKQPRSDIPAVTHVDYSARVQSVDAERSPAFYNVIRAFEEKTGCAVVVNTSFNVRGEPIVCSPEDAYRCFMRTGMELLVMEECVLEKSEQPPLPDDDKWQQEYELD
jgi:carbamoyltransferase